MKKNRICQYCGITFENIEGRKFSNHVKWCDHNPYRDDEERSRKISEGLSYIAEKRREDYYQNPNYCSNCGDVMPFEIKRRKFCDKEECKKQARSISVLKDDTKETKMIECAECGKEIEVNKRASPKYTKCNDCKNLVVYKKDDDRVKTRRLKFCRSCGSPSGKCQRPDICKKHQLFPTLIKYFGFDESKVGTIEVYEEFERVKNILIEDHWDKKLSTEEMSEKYNHRASGNFRKILRSLGIEIRNISDANRNTYETGKRGLGGVDPKFQNGWHKTWNGKDVFYRSSYELRYAQWLDEQQIDYDMEGLRILYWDSQKQIQRTAIPDFYLPEHGMVVEIKSNWTYDEQNMKDKFKEYSRHGYNFKLVLEGEEYKGV